MAVGLRQNHQIGNENLNRFCFFRRLLFGKLVGEKMETTFLQLFSPVAFRIPGKA
jgi:hypothetical protein